MKIVIKTVLWFQFGPHVGQLQRTSVVWGGCKEQAGERLQHSAAGEVLQQPLLRLRVQPSELQYDTQRFNNQYFYRILLHFL